MDTPKVLIIGVGRSGTTTLIKALGSLLKLKQCGEPWNRAIRDGVDTPEEDVISNYGIVKTLIGHMPLSYAAGESKEEYWDNCVNFYKTFVSNYDKVILLSRKGRKDIALSAAHQYARSRSHRSWQEPYIALPENTLDLNMDHANRACNSIERLSKSINVPITWYEDLYSGDHTKISDNIAKWNIDISVDDLYRFVDPRHRFRREIKGKRPLL